jgi:MraZ protein
LFLGRFTRKLDARNRIAIPPAYQAELIGGGYMTQGFDQNLQVFTGNAFQQLYRQAKSLNPADPRARLLLRAFLGNAVALAATEASVEIPESLREYALLRENVVLVGQGDYFEIWAPELWSQQEAELRNSEVNATRFATLGLGRREVPGSPMPPATAKTPFDPLH